MNNTTRGCCQKVVNMQRWVAKVITLCLIFIIPLICTLLPYKLHSIFEKKGEKGKKILSCLMCFGGGVFFATFILHMAPEVRHILEGALLKPMGIKYPLPDLLMAGGFFLVFFVEKLVLKWHKKRQQKKAKVREERCSKFNKMSSTNGNGIAGFPGPDQPGDCVLKGTGDCCTEPEARVSETAEAHMLPDIKEENTENQNAHSTRSLVLILALSMHRIFEGMGVGLQNSTHAVWSLFIAIMCHETVIAFALGLQFVNNKFSMKKMVVTSVLCSLIMPVGVAIGTILIETGEGGTSIDIVNGSLQAIATGTFIYVTFFEILQEEIDPHDTSMSKFFSVLSGFTVIALLSLVPKEEAGVAASPSLLGSLEATTQGSYSG